MKNQTLIMSTLLLCNAAMAELPAGYWAADRTQPILDATLEVTLDSDLSHLTAAEARGVIGCLTREARRRPVLPMV